MHIAPPFRLAGVGLLAVFAAACADTATAPDDFAKPAFLVGDVVNNTLTRSEVRVCQLGSAGNFSVTAPTGNHASINIADGECKIVAEGVGPVKTANVTLNTVSGQTVTSIDITTGVASSALPFPQTTNSSSISDGSTGASGTYGLEHGTVIVYTTRVAPPPPPGGGEGCTPGYWKQEHHFDSYPAGISPHDLFSAYFENAFPGMTLVEVASQGGGGLKALGRHTVAAFLNASSTGVSYDMSATEVVDAFNAVFPGGDYDGLKDIFEDFNEQGCPLN